MSAVVLLSPASCSSSSDAEPEGPRTVVFADEEQCENLTGRLCDFVMCDFVPEGRTFAETCGPYFQEGITASDLTNDDVDETLGRFAECAGTSDIVDQVMRVDVSRAEWLIVSGPDAWLDEWRTRYQSGCNI